MSSEYTIDIQLTELGFPDILKPLEAHVREPSVLASSCPPFSHNHSTSFLSSTSGEKQPVKCNLSVPKDRQVTGVAQTNDIQQATAAASPYTTQPPTQRLQEKQANSQCSVEAAKSSVFPAKSLASSPNNRLGHSTGQGASEILPGTSEENNGGNKTENGRTGVDELETNGNSIEIYESEETDDSEASDMEEDEEEEESMEEEEGQDNEPRSSGDYCCDVCDLRLPSNRKLQDHMNLHTGARPYFCVECGKRFCQMSTYRAHLRTHSQSKVNTFHCRICRRQFESEGGLKGHLSTTHFENKFYECDLCKRIYTNLRRCQQHVEWHKRSLANFQCENCGRIFSQANYLARHMKKKKCRCPINNTKAHKKKRKRNYSCTDCPRNFAGKNSLLKHSFSHLGLLPYTCIQCHCHFRLARLYWKHKCEPQCIHCVACLRDFHSKMDFEMHKKDTGCWGHQEPEGNKIRCLECGQIFATKEQLKSHAGAHQRVLSCAECGKGFRSALLLMSHMGGHVGHRPCLCQNCGLGFPHQQGYDSHLKTCGKIPAPVTALKKRASNSSQPPVKPTPLLVEKLPLPATAPTNASNLACTAITVHTDVPAAPVKDLISHEHVTEGMSGGSGPEDDKNHCLECGQSFATPEQLQSHASVHQAVLSCAECGKGFRSASLLMSHMGGHVGQRPRLCQNCGLGFPHQKGYDNHLKTCGEIPASVSALKHWTSNSSQPPVKPTLLLIEKLRLPATVPINASNLAHTAVTVHTDVTNIPAAPERNLISQGHVTEGMSGGSGPEDNKNRCLECGQSFTSPEQLQSHASVHQMVLSCAECGKGFRSASLLMSHMGGHVGQRPRLCHNCGLGFAQQQGYDNHLKTCGQIPASVSALKKRWASNSSPPPMKSTLQPVEKLQLPTTASMNASSLAHTTVKVHTDVTNIPAAPVKELINQEHVTEGMSGGSGQSEGVFQLTHDKLPPPALNLVLFVPVPQTLPAVDVLVKPPVALPLAPKAEPTVDLHEAASCVGVNSVSGAQLHIDSPLDLVSARKQDPVSVVPLDLSKKFISPLPSFTQAPSVKIEPEDPTFSEEVETETFPRTDCVEQNIKSSETMPESDRQTAAKQLKPMEFSTSPGLIDDIKKELDSPGLDFHMVSSESCLLTVESPAKEIKMEVDE